VRQSSLWLFSPEASTVLSRLVGSDATNGQLEIAHLIGFSKPQDFVKVQRAPSSFHMLSSNPWFVSLADINGFMLKIFGFLLWKPKVPSPSPT